MPGYAYEPAAFAGWIWNKTRALGSLGRAYNYPHQVSVYHSMYRILRENNLATAEQPALWYLKQAAMTIKVWGRPARLPFQQASVSALLDKHVPRWCCRELFPLQSAKCSV